MSWSFIISLAIFLVCVYICENSADEIVYLAASIAAFCAILTVILAPWPIQVVLLLLILLSNRRHFLPSESLEESQEPKKAQLIYRGAKYKLTPSSQDVMTEVEMTGKYRGQVWKAHDLVNTTTLQSTASPNRQAISITTQQSIAPSVQEQVVEQKKSKLLHAYKRIIHAH
jgi:membrane protein implicated in regulation of membrane protease activity